MRDPSGTSRAVRSGTALQSNAGKEKKGEKQRERAHVALLQRQKHVCSTCLVAAEAELTLNPGFQAQFPLPKTLEDKHQD